jgi:hypothetical protein
MNFQKAFIHVLFGRREEILIRGSELLFEKQLEGIYKSFIKQGSPEFLLKRLAAVHVTYYKGFSVEVEMDSAHKATVHYTGFEKQHYLSEYGIIGFFRKALEISGAKNVAAGFTTKISAGTGVAELALTWN